jgi:hypothetical protein
LAARLTGRFFSYSAPAALRRVGAAWQPVIIPGAQTERRCDAGLVSALLGRKQLTLGLILVGFEFSLSWSLDLINAKSTYPIASNARLISAPHRCP